MSLYVVPKSISLLKNKILLGQKEEFKNKLSNLNIGTFSVPSLGERSLSHWRAVSAKGASEVAFLTTSFCAYSAPVCWNILTQGVTLGYIPIGLSARLCGVQTRHT